MCIKDLELLPEGWVTSFGELLCEDVNKELEQSGLNDIQIQDAKEKYGSMRIYYSGGNAKVDNIIKDYSVLSENICMICGKPDVYMTLSGWYFPCCKECWNSDKLNSKRPYEECIDTENDTGKMQNERSIVYHVNGKSKIVKYDLRDKADRIRKYWKEKYE